MYHHVLLLFNYVLCWGLPTPSVLLGLAGQQSGDIKELVRILSNSTSDMLHPLKIHTHVQA
jgi:hypothetical protein